MNLDSRQLLKLKKNKQTDNKMRIQEYPDTFGQGLRLQCL